MSRPFLRAAALGGALACGPDAPTVTIRPTQADGPVPPTVQPVVAYAPFWGDADALFDREGYPLVKAAGGAEVGTSRVGFANGFVLAPSVALAEGGDFLVGDARFTVSPTATGVAPTDAPWTSATDDASIDADGVLNLLISAEPPPTWFEVLLVAGSGCRLELIAVDGVVGASPEACGLDAFPASGTVRHRPIDVDGTPGPWSDPLVIDLPSP